MGWDTINLFGDEYVTMSGIIHRESEDESFFYKGVFVKYKESYIKALERFIGGFPEDTYDVDIGSHGKSEEDYVLDDSLV